MFSRFGLAVIVAGIAVPAAAASLGPPPGAASCSGCHTAKPASPDQLPSLNGRDAAEIVASVKAFRAGERPATLMEPHRQGLQRRGDRGDRRVVSGAEGMTAWQA